MPTHQMDPTGLLVADLTADVALDLLAQAVAERGRDYRFSEHYPKPDYTDPDRQPACLIALALHHYGVPTAALHAWDDGVPEVFGLTYPVAGHLADLPRIPLLAPTSVADANYEGVPPATEAAIRLLWAAQIVQDGPGNLGEALDTARALHVAMTEIGQLRAPDTRVLPAQHPTARPDTTEPRSLP